MPDQQSQSQQESSLFRKTSDGKSRFRLIRRLGQGGMGMVYLAYDNQLQRQVAIKVPRHTDASNDMMERFFREARSAAALRHPNICPIYDVGEMYGVRFITMAYIEGLPLTEYISRNLSQKQIANLVRQIALALQHAHERGVVHRDLKPANIIVNRDQGPVVMDFGLARRLNIDETLTQTGIIVGTPAYMSPEQVKGDSGNIGPASDIFSLGVILYELLVKQRPFRGTLSAILGAIELVDPLQPTLLRADIDSQLEAVCLKALKKSPAERFASMKEFADALDRWLKTGDAGLPVREAATPLGLPPAQTSAYSMSGDESTTLRPPSRDQSQIVAEVLPLPSRRQWLIVGGIAAMLGLLLFVPVMIFLALWLAGIFNATDGLADNTLREKQQENGIIVRQDPPQENGAKFSKNRNVTFQSGKLVINGKEITPVEGPNGVGVARTANLIYVLIPPGFDKAEIEINDVANETILQVLDTKSGQTLSFQQTPNLVISIPEELRQSPLRRSLLVTLRP